MSVPMHKVPFLMPVEVSNKVKLPFLTTLDVSN